MKTGTKVVSPMYGSGTVISFNVEKNAVCVDFSGELKNLHLRFAKLTNLDGQPLYVAPVKAAKPKKAALPKIDYSKYTDAELAQMHADLMGDVYDAKIDARKDGKISWRTQL